MRGPLRRQPVRDPLRRRPFGERTVSVLHELRRERALLADRAPAIPRRGGVRANRVT